MLLAARVSSAQVGGSGSIQGTVLDASGAAVPTRRNCAAIAATPTTPLAPPTRVGPAMLFENVKGYGMPVVAGVLASRLRTARPMVRFGAKPWPNAKGTRWRKF